MNEPNAGTTRRPRSTSRDRGLLFIISGPSGAGKGTALSAILERFPSIRKVPTYTTRPPRPNEVPGYDYAFLDTATFLAKVRAGEVFEYTRTYGDSYYGSPQVLVDDDGSHLAVELDYKGMFQVRHATARRCTTIFVMPPDLAEAERRIRSRYQETNVEARLANFREQLQFAWAYDYVLSNHTEPAFREEVQTVIRAELLRHHGGGFLLNNAAAFDWSNEGGTA